MKIFEYPSPLVWKELLQRPVFDSSGLQATVQNILKEIQRNGDEAVRSFTLSFDKVLLNDFAVPESAIESAGSMNYRLGYWVNKAK